MEEDYFPDAGDILYVVGSSTFSNISHAPERYIVFRLYIEDVRGSGYSVTCTAGKNQQSGSAGIIIVPEFVRQGTIGRDRIVIILLVSAPDYLFESLEFS